uniref:Uncharacterized protein n=1 Tax=Anguilla anguilla TaxID=7936 RepID=A0A0E9T3D2_ANGAN
MEVFFKENRINYILLFYIYPIYLCNTSFEQCSLTFKLPSV